MLSAYKTNQHPSFLNSRYTEAMSESKDTGGGHWKSRSKKKKSDREEEDFELRLTNPTEYGVSSSLSNTAYSSQQINTAYPLPLDTAYFSVRMTKVIKGEFEKIKDVKVEDVSLTCNTSLEIFNMEVSRLSEMDNDLFTYKVEVANILCNSVMDDDLEDETDDDMGYDPSDVAFIEWLRIKNFKLANDGSIYYEALWIYWIEEMMNFELTNE
ncbi:hypothetical protein Tco_1191333 [Tanacetum coccineum]